MCLYNSLNYIAFDEGKTYKYQIAIDLNFLFSSGSLEQLPLVLRCISIPKSHCHVFLTGGGKDFQKGQLGSSTGGWDPPKGGYTINSQKLTFVQIGHGFQFFSDRGLAIPDGGCSPPLAQPLVFYFLFITLTKYNAGYCCLLHCKRMIMKIQPGERVLLWG